MKAALLFAVIAHAATGKDWVGSFWNRSLSREEAAAFVQAVEVLARTSSGRKILSEVGVGAEGRFDLAAFSRRGIVLRVSRVKMRDWANARPPFSELFSESPKQSRITFDRSMLRAPAVLIAPVVLHELVHSSDRRTGITTPSERRGYLLQMHVLVELEEQGLLSEAENMADVDARKLIRDYRQLLRVYRGVSIPLSRYGTRFVPRVKKSNEYRASNPGLRAFLAHVELKLAVGEDIGPWDRSEDLSQKVKDYYAAVEQEDYLFQVSRPSPSAQLATAYPAVGSGKAQLGPNPGPFGGGEVELAKISLARDAVTLAGDLCESGFSPVLLSEVRERWPSASVEVRDSVRQSQQRTNNRCVARVLAGLLDRASFRESDLIALIKEPVTPPPFTDDGEKPEKPKRCFKFGVWSKEEYCF